MRKLIERVLGWLDALGLAEIKRAENDEPWDIVIPEDVWD